MRTVPAALPAALLALTISAILPQAIHAQDAASKNGTAQAADPTATPFLQNAAAPEGVISVTAEERLATSVCPGVAIPIKVAYPQGFDAGGPVDKAVKAKTDSMMARAKTDAEEYAEKPEECDPLSNASYGLNSTAYRISSKAHSVLFIWDQYMGGAHPVYGYVSMNLAADGTELTAANLFTDPAKSLPLLWERIYRSTCSGDHETAPSYYGSPACSKDAVPALPEPLAPGSTLDVMGHATLTSLGLTINLDPYDAWSWAEGPVRLDIPKADLVTMGADPALWN
ncbi:MAG: DUF4163 domain-containing protein [Deltaproteobacteria bacterium]|jgi:hypothetical protein|nr:DUF4163 domain-containing protein [Deltaproteobacteria bacterium]